MIFVKINRRLVQSKGVHLQPTHPPKHLFIVIDNWSPSNPRNIYLQVISHLPSVLFPLRGGAELSLNKGVIPRSANLEVVILNFKVHEFILDRYSM